MALESILLSLLSFFLGTAAFAGFKSSLSVLFLDLRRDIAAALGDPFLLAGQTAYYARFSEPRLISIDKFFVNGIIGVFVAFFVCAVALVFTKAYSYLYFVAVILVMAGMNAKLLDPAKKALVKSAEKSPESLAAGRTILLVHGAMFVISTFMVVSLIRS